MLTITETLQGIQDGDTRAILWGASLYFMLCAVYSLIFQLRVRQWDSVWGEAIAEKVELMLTDPEVSEREYSAKVLYRYTVADQHYEGHRLSPWIMVVSHNARLVLQQQMKGIARNKKGQVQVFFNPRNPQKSYLILPGYFGMLLTIILCLFPLGLYLLKYGL